MLLLPAIVSLLLLLVPQQGTLTGAVIATRTDAQKRETLLVDVPAAIGDRPVTEIRVGIGRDVARLLAPASLPEGWRAVTSGDELRLSGPPHSRLLARFVGPGSLTARFDVPLDVRLELYSGGTRVARAEQRVERREPVDPGAPLDRVLGLPPVISEGDTIRMTPLEPKLTPAGGTWTIEPIDPEGSRPDVTLSGSSIGLTLGYGLGPKDLAWKVSYTDAYGEVLVDAKPPAMEIVEDAPGRGASITGCTQKSFRGRVICVCGSFPDEPARSRLTIDGTPLGEPLTSSRHVLYFRLPETIAAGPHTIALAGAEGTASIEVLELSGQIDQRELLRGQSTPIHIRIAGTREPLSLSLVNHTPGVITLQGGNDQVITTSGGDANGWSGTVRGHTPGDFKLTYELTAGRCPCAELASTSPDRPRGETWYDDTRERFERGRDLSDEARDAELNGDDNARDLAREALEELERAREALDRGVKAGDIGPESAKLFSEYITSYESQARAVTAAPPSVPVTQPPDDPRDAPAPPISSRPEERERPRIVVTDGWFQPSQGVWQDDDDFRDAPGKRLTRLGPARWRAELKMVAGRYSALFGIRDDTGAPKYQRIHLKGVTTATRLAKVRFRFTKIQNGRRVMIYEQPSSRAQDIWMDGPAGREREWSASLWTVTGVPDGHLFTFDPGEYTIEAELVRDDTGQPTGLKAFVQGEAVTTTAPVLHFIPVTLGPSSPAAQTVLGRLAGDLANRVRLLLPDYLPVAPNGLTVQTHPLQALPGIQPGALRELISMLPLADDSDTVRRERLDAALTSFLTLQSALTGGGKVVAVLQQDEFLSLWPNDNVGAYASSQKLMTVPNTSSIVTVGHEIAHTVPFVWTDEQMREAFGFSYHNSEDRNYADGVQLSTYARTRHDTVKSMMGPVGGEWITQGTYWQLLEQFRTRPDPPLIVVRGFLGRARGATYGRLEPLYDVMGVPDLGARAAAAGEVAIELRDAAGRPLGRFPFAASWRVPDAEVERSLVAFSFTVPDSPNAAEVVLLGPDGAVLHARRRSANAPVVQILTPAAASRATAAGNRLRVTWQASDADGDRLTYTVLFSPDRGRTWRVAAQEITATSYDIALAGVPASGRVRVIAADGTRSGQAEVAFTFQR